MTNDNILFILMLFGNCYWWYKVGRAAGWHDGWAEHKAIEKYKTL
jgi:hypothetical protein